MIEDNKQIARRFIEALGTNDAATVAQYFAADGKAVTKGHSHFSGTRDAAEVIRTLASFLAVLPKGLQLTVTNAIGEGDRVVVEAEGNTRTADGAPYHNQYCFVLTFNDGKVAHFSEYFCTLHAEQVLWPAVVQAHNGQSFASG